LIRVPEGECLDAARDPPIFDVIAEFLVACGARPLDEENHRGSIVLNELELPL
jgi:hypothetical protein